MNKSTSAHIGGLVFNLDELAYQQLLNYLNNVKKSLGDTDGVEEIMQDVESRIAEMLNKLLMASNRQVVIPTDIDAVIKEMGKPEDFNTGSSTMESEQKSNAQSKKKFFRDPDDKILGGVCSGISAYFDVDALWIRLAFVLLFLGWGTGVLFYIILWIVIPEAKSSADKLRMRGEPVNIANIEKNIKDELNQVKQRASKMANESGFSNIGKSLHDTLLFIGTIIRGLIKAVAMVGAGFILFITLIIVFALFASLFGVMTSMPGLNIPVFVSSIFSGHNQFEWALLGVVLTIGIPLLSLAWLAARFMFGLKLPRVIGFITLFLWIIGLALVIFIGINTVTEFKEEQFIKSEVSFDSLNANTLFVQSMTSETSLITDVIVNDDWILDEKDHEIKSGNVKLDIEKSPDNKFHLLKYSYSYGSGKKDALNNASHINYSIGLENDSLLKLSRTFNLGPEANFRKQRLLLLLQVPIGKSVKLDASVKDQLYNIENVQNIYDDEMSDRTWTMTTDGLSCNDCTGRETMIGNQ